MPSASKLRGWPPASFPALHEQGLPQGLVQPVPPLCGTMFTVQCGSVRSRCVPALVPRCVQVPARMQGLPSGVHWRGSAERLPSHTVVDHVWAIGADNHLPFPTHTFSLDVGASVLWPFRVVRISGWCASCQKRSLMLAFDALGGWAGRSVSVGRAREFPAAQLARVGASVSPNAASWHAVCCQMLKCVCVRGRKFPVEEPVFICLLLLLLVISQNASSH